MNQKLKAAIAATRTGQKREAQKLLAETLQENPNEVHAWYLLSLLVDSESKQLAYLKKTLALDPNHEKAQQRLAQSQIAPPPVITPALEPEPETSPMPEAPDAETYPDWLIEEDEPELEEAAPFLEEASDLDLELAELPDWLLESSDIAAAEDDLSTPVPQSLPDEALADAEATVASAPVEVTPPTPSVAPVVAAPAPKPASRPTAASAAAKRATATPRRNAGQMNRLLLLLVAGAVVIFILLIYMVFITILAG